MPRKTAKRASAPWVCVAVFAATALSGCAAARRVPAADGGASLETFIEQVRQLSLKARPAPANEAATLERDDPELALARLALTAAPTADHFRRVAELYARRGVRDAAYKNFASALRLNPRDADALEGQARVWRDWGMPHLGLGPAYRALAIAPDAPRVQNTLGTLLIALGQYRAARTVFERTLRLDPGAAYVLNNLCYTATLEGDHPRAIAQCRAAVAADPRLRQAHNNLALAYAAAGDFEAASREFLSAGDAAAERYNMGVALMATAHYAEAAAAFDEAAVLEPWLEIARLRARQAKNLTARQAPEHDQR